MQKVSFCDYRGLEYTLSVGWRVNTLHIMDDPRLTENGKTPFFVVFDIPEPTPEPGTEPEPQPELVKRKSFAATADLFGFCSLIFLWGFFLGVVVMGMMTKR